MNIPRNRSPNNNSAQWLSCWRKSVNQNDKPMILRPSSAESRLMCKRGHNPKTAHTCMLLRTRSKDVCLNLIQEFEYFF